VKRTLLAHSLRVLRSLQRVALRAARPASPVARAIGQASDTLAENLLAKRIAELEERAQQQYASIVWLSNQLSSGDRTLAAPLDSAPRVSVVMPTWNRAGVLPRAIASVRAQAYPKWELLVADDGSTDETAALLRQLEATEPRIRYLPAPHAGHAAARNRALAHASGEIIAYLDSDNIWYPQFLTEVVRVFERHPEVESLYLAQLVFNQELAEAFIRCDPFDAERLEQENYIDINAFANRRSCLDRYGGFDERLTRLVDYDLIRRYAKCVPPLRVERLGGRYEESAAGSVTENENLHHNAYQIQRKWERPVNRPLRVLYALWHYPQLSESYVRWEIAYMRRRGVQIEVWSELDSCPAPFDSEVPVQHGALAEVIARVDPDIVHVHWSNRAELYLDAVSDAGLPMTVRDHAFDYSSRLVGRLVDDDVVKRIYLFPHLAAQLHRSSQIQAMPVAFNGDLYPPSKRKDPRLVLRTAAALRTKDLSTFFEVALRCPDHEFVLLLVECAGEGAYLEELQAYNGSLGNPVDLRVNVAVEDVAELMARAGIYLHTHGLITPYGMPISIAEAMATGSYVIGRRCAGSQAYIGEAGALYDDCDEAVALIHETEGWSEERWRSTRLEAVERAYERFADIQVLPAMLDDWLSMAGSRKRRARSDAHTQVVAAQN